MGAFRQNSLVALWTLLVLAGVAVARADGPGVAGFRTEKNGWAFASLKLGENKLRVVIDTGATTTLVDARFRNRLGAEVGTGQASSAVATSTVSRYECTGGAVGGLELGLPALVCVDLGEGWRTAGVDGVLGLDFLRRYCVDFDWEAGSVKISAARPKRIPGQVDIPLVSDNLGLPYLIADCGSARRLSMLVDTGFYRAVALAADDEKKVFPDGWGKSIKSNTTTMHGETHGQLTRLPRLVVHGLESTNLLCEVGDSRSKTTCVGCGFLRRYHAIFDFPRNTLTLIPRAKPITDEEDMSGLNVRRSGKALLAYRVDDGSPAARAGVRGGEIVVRVDGVDASRLRAEDIRVRLRSGDGKVVRLRLKDGDGEREVKIVLVRQI
jgi:predicted aspartyl protease